MKLDLNIKEWIALYGLLERQVPSPDKQIVEIHNRMRSTLVTIMQEADRDQFDKWFKQTEEQVNDLASQNKTVIDELKTTVKSERDTDVDDLGEESLIPGYPKPGTKRGK